MSHIGLGDKKEIFATVKLRGSGMIPLVLTEPPREWNPERHYCRDCWDTMDKSLRPPLTPEYIDDVVALTNRDYREHLRDNPGAPLRDADIEEEPVPLTQEEIELLAPVHLIAGRLE
jgi:hypothetical protein